MDCILEGGSKPPDLFWGCAVQFKRNSIPPKVIHKAFKFEYKVLGRDLKNTDGKTKKREKIEKGQR